MAGPAATGPDAHDAEAAERVADAMRAVPRERFLPREIAGHAREDRALPLWHGQTGSQPSTVAAMLRLLDVPVGARVLDVGAGSGWTTALLAHLTGPTGAALGLELDESLAAWGAANVDATGCTWAVVEPADPGALGRPTVGGWDRILVSASAHELPDALVAQLADGGRLVVPVRTTMHLVVRRGAGRVVSTHGEYVFVPLR
jgi:protein-L-isoaspartate(D-aspartate) O-methyltransferase